MSITKLSAFPRTISCIVMMFTGWLMLRVVEWALSLPVATITTPQAALTAAVLTPIAAIFKFSFDFAGDGKIDIK